MRTKPAGHRKLEIENERISNYIGYEQNNSEYEASELKIALLCRLANSQGSSWQDPTYWSRDMCAHVTRYTGSIHVTYPRDTT